MTPLQLDPSAHAPWTRTMEGLGPDPVSDLAATTYAGTMRIARIASGMNFFISMISPLWMVLRLRTVWFDKLGRGQSIAGKNRFGVRSQLRNRLVNCESGVGPKPRPELQPGL